MPKRRSSKPPDPSLLLSQAIQATPEFEKFQRSSDRATFSLDVRTITKELLSLHAKRSIRSLRSGDILANQQVQMIDANLQNQSYRSRATELRIKVFRASAKLDELCETFIKFNINRFLVDFQALGIRSIGDRRGFIEDSMVEQRRMLNRFNETLEIADKIIDDLDQSSFALMRIQKAVELTTLSRER